MQRVRHIGDITGPIGESSREEVSPRRVPQHLPLAGAALDLPLRSRPVAQDPAALALDPPTRRTAMLPALASAAPAQPVAVLAPVEHVEPQWAPAEDDSRIKDRSEPNDGLRQAVSFDALAAPRAALPIEPLPGTVPGSLLSAFNHRQDGRKADRGPGSEQQRSDRLDLQQVLREFANRLTFAEPGQQAVQQAAPPETTEHRLPVDEVLLTLSQASLRHRRSQPGRRASAGRGGLHARHLMPQGDRALIVGLAARVRTLATRRNLQTLGPYSDHLTRAGDGGLERWMDLSQEHPEEAARLLRQYVQHSGRRGEHHALLTTLAQLLENERLGLPAVLQAHKQ